MDNAIVLFGAGEEIIKYGKHIDWDRVVCIVDNDPKNFHKKINGKMIFPVAVLNETEFSQIVIFHTRFLNQMHAQLIQLKVPEEKIVCWTNFVEHNEDHEIALKVSDILAKLKVRAVLDETDFFADFGPVKCVQDYAMDSIIKLDTRYDAVLMLNEYPSKSPEELLKAVQSALNQAGTVIFNIPYPCPAECTVWNTIAYGRLGRCHVLPCLMSQIVVIEKAVPDECDNKKIYITVNKKTSLPPSVLYQPIWVGKAANEDGYLDDRMGESISNLYPLLDDYTALFWLWKHTGDGIIGINQHNRFFMRNDVFLDRGNLLDSAAVNEYMEQYDMILAKPMLYTDATLKEQLMASVSNAAFDAGWALIIESVEKNQPDYLDVFNKVMDGHLFFPHNMFIAKKELMDSCCEWLFSILLEPAYKINVSSFDPYSRRILGLIAERLMTVWVTYNGPRVKALPVLQTE